MQDESSCDDCSKTYSSTTVTLIAASKNTKQNEKKQNKEKLRASVSVRILGKEAQIKKVIENLCLSLVARMHA